MANAAETFLKSFIEGTSKKKRYGHYYVVIYDDVKYLLHHNPEKGRGSYRGTEKPYLMLVRDEKGNILVCAENVGFVTRHVGDDYLTKHASYWFSLEEIEKGKLDVTTLSIVDTKLIKRTIAEVDKNDHPAGQWEGEIPLTLYNIDGTRFLTDLSHTMPAVQVGNWLAFDDFQYLDPRTMPTLQMVKVPGSPKTVDEARLKQLHPSVASEPNLHILGASVVVPPVEESEVAYPRDVVEAISGAFRGWERMATASFVLDHGTPQDPSYRRNEKLAKHLSDKAKARDKRWKVAQEERFAIVKRFSAELDAAEVRLKELGIEAADVRFTDAGIYVREAAVVGHPTENESLVASLGDTWHKVIPFVGR